MEGFGEDLAVPMELAPDSDPEKSTKSIILSGFLIFTPYHTVFQLTVGFSTLCLDICCFWGKPNHQSPVSLSVEDTTESWRRSHVAQILSWGFSLTYNDTTCMHGLGRIHAESETLSHSPTFFQINCNHHVSLKP